jgi:molecular chaperone DnaK
MVGIDLGTCYSAVAVADGSRVRVLPGPDGNPQMPSVVARTAAGDWLVGEAALRQAPLNPRHTLFAVKRLLGRRLHEVRPTEMRPGVELATGCDGFVRVRIAGELYAPQELAARILRRLRAVAEHHLGRPVCRAVLAVPAHFDPARRQALLEAADIAGFQTDWHLVDPDSGKVRQQPMRLVHEPVAAALGYALRQQRTGRVAVLDLGGSRCHGAVLEMDGGILEVLAYGGDTELGGEDFDQALVNEVADALRRQGADVRAHPAAWERLRAAVEQARRDLSHEGEAVLDLPHLDCGAGLTHVQTPLRRGQCERLTAHLVDKLRAGLRQLLADARLKPGDVAEVLLVGGLARWPAVQALVREVFGRDPHGGLLPEEAVAAGAAVLADQIRRGSRSDLVLVDATPQSLHLELAEGELSRVAARYTSIPFERRQTIATARDFQTCFSVRLWQGEGDKTTAAGMRLLGELQVRDLKPLPKGEAKVEVTVSVGGGGSLAVSACDLQTGRKWPTQLSAATGLTARDVEHLRRQADEEARMDRLRQEVLQARHQAEEVLTRAGQLLGCLSPADREPLQALVRQVCLTAAGNDAAAIRDVLHELERTLEAVARYVEAAAPAARPIELSLEEPATISED